MNSLNFTFLEEMPAPVIALTVFLALLVILLFCIFLKLLLIMVRDIKEPEEDETANLVWMIGKLKDLETGVPALDEQVTGAEEALGLTFAKEYAAYLKAYGLASGRGIKLTGITRKVGRGVVPATLSARKANPMIPGNMYVVMDDDEMSVLQDGDGSIYLLWPDKEPEWECNSLTEYLKGT